MNKVFTTTLAGLAIAGLAACGSVAGTSSTHPATLDRAPATTAPQTTAPQTTAPSVNTAQAWLDGGGTTLLQHLDSDYAGIKADLDAQDSSALIYDCTALRDDAATGLAYADFPIAAGAADWQSALNYYSKAGNECVTAFTSDTSNVELARQAGEDLGNGRIAETQVLTDIGGDGSAYVA